MAKVSLVKTSTGRRCTQTLVPQVYAQRPRLLLDSMMRLRLMLISQVLLVVLLLVETNWALSCGPCDKASCPTALQCPGGQVLDVCRCCYECAKQKGEICGGLWGLSGTCDQGLRCIKHGRGRHSEGVCRGTKRGLRPPQTSQNTSPLGVCVSSPHAEEVVGVPPGGEGGGPPQDHHRAASCWQRPVGSVLWAASSGQSPVGSVLWPASCGQRPVGSILWAASCGQPPVGSILWAASSGQRPVGDVLWAASCGKRPVTTDDSLEDDQHCTVQQQMSYRL
ncbi:hypothetical protein NFI96_024484 [Prochilodus magdalenae]|nr:hypothetical protein NFI96_024484 [Prochilodus magdalenae]